MQLSHYLGMPLASVHGLYIHNGQIGLEFEVEGKNIAPWTTTLWKCKPDGSLRGGFEWILNGPQPLHKALVAVDEWFTYKKNYEMDTPFSHRTSIHVHINACKYTLKQIYQVITAYWLVEDLLCKFSGPTREGNLFCLRVRDADYAATKLCEGIINGTFFGQVNSDEFKYAALNLQAICKYGSFEFRMMRGAYEDAAFIKAWIISLNNLVDNAAHMFDSPLEIVKFYDKHPDELLNKLFGLPFAIKLREQHPFWKEMMDEHYHYALTLATTPPSWQVENSNVDEHTAFSTVISNQVKAKNKKIKPSSIEWEPTPVEETSDWEQEQEALENMINPEEEIDL